MNKKISEMTYKQLAADDYIPAVNPVTDPTENYYFLGGDIASLIGISKWDSLAVYDVGHVVIYDGTNVKGTFLVNTITSAGDSPENTGSDKFSSMGLSYIPISHIHLDNIGYERTGYITFGLSGAAVEVFTLYSDLIKNSTSHKVTATLFRNGVSVASEDILIKSLGITTGEIHFYVEKTTVGAVGSVRIAYTIEG